MNSESLLIDVEQVANLLNCSVRHVYRMVDSGRMPCPVRLGTLCRWSRQTLTDWIATGCKPLAQAAKTKQQSSGNSPGLL
jgi:excisionase family DNA binding protein